MSLSTACRSILGCLLISAMAPAGASSTTAPKVGDPAPVFRLTFLESGNEIDLQDLIGGRPIVLFFGSHT